MCPRRSSAPRYGSDVLAAGRQQPRRYPPTVAAAPGLAVVHRASGFAGRVRTIDGATVTLDDGTITRLFRLTEGGFLVDGAPATLVRPAVRRGEPARTASGSVRGAATGPRVARANRIWVEGLHDAELLEKVWGDDLREAGIVVEPLGGADDLPAAVAAFRPGPSRRLGVLLDHLVPGTKEHRLADAVSGPAVLVAGHPYVDVWQGVRPRAVGIAAWPQIPRGRPWKEGICAAIGTGEPPAVFWRRLLGAVDSYADLEQPLVGAVERLLDFVTEA